MKLVDLNVWGGRLHQPLMQFFEKFGDQADIFCLQEVFSSEALLGFSGVAKINLYQDISKILTNHKGYYARKSHGYDYGGYIGKEVDFGNVIFVKKDIEVLDHQELFEAVLHPDHDWRESAVAKAQFLKIKTEADPLTICNFHGLWVKDTHKKDIPERIEQSKHVRNYLDAFAGPKILCGDFNLIPEGQSIKILEQGMRNLITEFQITSTRSSIYTKEMKFADYILTSPDLQVKDFKTLPDEVSDHLALILDFDCNQKNKYGPGN